MTSRMGKLSRWWIPLRAAIRASVANQRVAGRNYPSIVASLAPGRPDMIFGWDRLALLAGTAPIVACRRNRLIPDAMSPHLGR